MRKLAFVSAIATLAVLALACSRESQKASTETAPSAGASAQPASAPAAGSAKPSAETAADAATGTLPGAATGPRLYVSNEASGDVTIIDLATGKVQSTLPVGKRPRGIQRAPNGSAVYVALS